MDIGDRIKFLRKSANVNLTLEKFGDRIGHLSKGTVSAMENGVRGVTDQTIMSICREFHVNERWLRYGEPPMFTGSAKQEQIRSWIDRILVDEPDSYKVRLVAALAELDETGWKAIYDLAVKMVGSAKGQSVEERGEMLKQSYIDSCREGGESSESSGGSTKEA